MSTYLYIQTIILTLGNGIGEKGAAILAPAIGQLQRLEKLDLSGERRPRPYAHQVDYGMNMFQVQNQHVVVVL